MGKRKKKKRKKPTTTNEEAVPCGLTSKIIILALLWAFAVPWSQRK